MILVEGALGAADDADGGGEVGWVEGCEEARVEWAGVVGAVDEEVRGVAGDDFGFESVEADGFGFVFAEDEGVSFFEDEHLVVAVFLGVDGVPGGVVEDDAILEDFDEGDAGVVMGGGEGFHHVLDVVIDGSGDEGGFGAEGEEDGVERVIDGAEWGGFGAGSFEGGGAVLAFG